MIFAAIKAFLSGPIITALRGVDYRIWLVIGFVLTVQITSCTSYNRGYKAGETAVLDKLREEEAKAVTRSIEAAAKGDAFKAERAEIRAQVYADSIKEIEQAEREGLSAVDSVMGW